VQLYPNPTDGLVWFNGLTGLAGGPAELAGSLTGLAGGPTPGNEPATVRLRLFDQSGKVLMNLALADPSHPLQLPESLPDGLYLLAWSAGAQSGMLPLVLNRP
jgi:hypothetical protein